MPRPKGGYRLSDGTRVPGVTTILRQWGLKTEPMVWWAFRTARENPDLNSPYDKADEAASVGTAVHAAIELSLDGAPDEDCETFCVGELPGTDDELANNALDGLREWFRWRDMTRMRPVEQEVSLVSETHKYGGTVDLVALFGDRLGIVDWKRTGGIYPDTQVQVVAYERLWLEHYPERELDGGVHIVRVGKGFDHKALPRDTEEYWQAFLHLRGLYDLAKAIK